MVTQRRHLRLDTTKRSCFSDSSLLLSTLKVVVYLVRAHAWCFVLRKGAALIETGWGKGRWHYKVACLFELCALYHNLLEYDQSKQFLKQIIYEETSLFVRVKPSLGLNNATFSVFGRGQSRGQTAVSHQIVACLVFSCGCGEIGRATGERGSSVRAKPSGILSSGTSSRCPMRNSDVFSYYDRLPAIFSLFSNTE